MSCKGIPVFGKPARRTGGRRVALPHLQEHDQIIAAALQRLGKAKVVPGAREPHTIIERRGGSGTIIRRYPVSPVGRAIMEV